FFNLNAGREDREVVASPGLATGRIDITAPSRLWGAEANVRHPLLTSCSYRVDLLAGFRYLQLEEALGIVEDVRVLPDAPSPFAVVPNLGVTLSYQATDHLRLFVGYDALWWTHVLRPGDQIDRTLDVSQIPNFPNPPPATGQGRPRVTFVDRTFWAQGANVGM